MFLRICERQDQRMTRYLEHALHLLSDEVAHSKDWPVTTRVFFASLMSGGPVEGLVPIHGVRRRRRVGIGVHRLDRHGAGLREDDLAGVRDGLEVPRAAADLKGGHASRTNDGDLPLWAKAGTAAESARAVIFRVAVMLVVSLS